jgi:hypothetical protein
MFRHGKQRKEPVHSKLLNTEKTVTYTKLLGNTSIKSRCKWNNVSGTQPFLKYAGEQDLMYQNV